jgi:hypothetical protein
MTALTLVTHGEVVEAVDAHTLLYAAGVPTLHDAPMEQLAEVKEKLSALKSITAEADGILDVEIVHRQDLDCRWTTHVGPYTVKSSSPVAGAVSFDVERLRAVLADLVTDGVISAAGAMGAVETIEPTASVPYGLLRDLLRAIGGHEDAPGKWELCERLSDLLAGEPEPTYKVKAAGVKALCKLPAARAAIEACQVPVEPPRRKATVKRAAA